MHLFGLDFELVQSVGYWTEVLLVVMKRAIPTYGIKVESYSYCGSLCVNLVVNLGSYGMDVVCCFSGRGTVGVPPVVDLWVFVNVYVWL